MPLPHGEMGTRTGVVQYEAYILGLASIIVGIVYRRGDAEPAVGPIFDKRQPRVCVPRGIVDNFLIRSRYHYWRCG